MTRNQNLCTTYQTLPKKTRKGANMEFYNSFNPGPRKNSPAGSRTEPVYGLKIDKNGHKILEKTSQVNNIYEKIQASLESTLIENIVKRYTMGDEAILSKNMGQFTDLTIAPENLLEAQQKLINAQELFDKEPIDVKKEFNQNMGEWLNALNNGTYENRAKKALKIADTPKIEKAISEETSAIEKVTGTKETI